MSAEEEQTPAAAFAEARTHFCDVALAWVDEHREEVKRVFRASGLTAYLFEAYDAVLDAFEAVRT